MPKSTTASTDVLSAVLKGVDPAWRAGANRYLAFHTANPGIGGSQLTSETAYTNYVRIPVPIADWTEAPGSFSNATLLQFAQCGVTAGSPLNYVTIGTSVSGAGLVLYVGALLVPLPIAQTIRPQFDIGTLIAVES